MQITLFNSLSKQKEQFVPIKEGHASIYSCGPTVYFTPHIGNYRSFVLSDLLRRMLEFNGYKVTQIINITDVGHLTDDADAGEDKLLVAALKSGKTVSEVAEEVSAKFINELEDLHIKTPTHLPMASQHVAEMIEAIEAIVKNGYSYVTSDGLYFDTEKLPSYGVMMNMGKETTLAGARIRENPEKKNQADFALWKFKKDTGVAGESVWDSPWGKGFPGWHIECSAMSRHFLGQPFDIHTGGIDHINIHHTNELAQAEAAYQKPLCNYWLHGEFLLFGDAKMSKSKGTLLTLDDLKREGFTPLHYRYLLMTAHYRSQLKFTFVNLSSAKNSFEALAQIYQESHSEDHGSVPNQEWITKFTTAINDDLNMPEAMSTVWQVARSDQLSLAERRATLQEFDKVLGLNLGRMILVDPREAEEKIVNGTGFTLEVLLDKREQARNSQNWSESDRLRKLLAEYGVLIEDTSAGQQVKYEYTAIHPDNS